jgi:aspartyl-tRNA(Asn)/glutamyl-tRNA(Gln) amidotransferase subunit A
MTEFAYSGLGINPHFGTPANPFERYVRRIPGGSSSGAAVSVTDGMSIGAIGTDTGGSCRIPAALTGIVGLKPTAERVPREGVLPLSTTLDSVGPLAATVSCCAILDSVLSRAEGEPEDVAPAEVRSLRFAIPTIGVLDDLDSEVAVAFDGAIRRLSEAGAHLQEIALPEFARLIALNADGGFHGPEGFAIHKRVLTEKLGLIDPRVSARLLAGGERLAADYLALAHERRVIIDNVRRRTAGYDALLMPTVPFVAPPIDALNDETRYRHYNRLAVRNCTIVNMLDRCAVSLPCHAEGRAPVGLMPIGEHGGDRRLLAIAAGMEAVLERAAAA